VGQLTEDDLYDDKADIEHDAKNESLAVGGRAAVMRMSHLQHLLDG